MNEELHEHLLEAYAGPRNANVWAGWLSDPIHVDHWTDADAPPLICPITATVSEAVPNEFRLDLSQSPATDDIRHLIYQRGGQIHQYDGHQAGRVSLVLTTRDVSCLRELAKAFRRAAGRRARYLDRNWKWLCPRIATALDELAAVLMAFRRSQASKRT